MKDWQQRAIDEQAELDARGQKLFDFVAEDGGAFDALSKEDRTMLAIQLGHMQAYNEALMLRISFFEDEEDGLPSDPNEESPFRCEEVEVVPCERDD